jgi:hypothetical protein
MEDRQQFLNDVLFVMYAGNLLNWPDLNRTNFQKILYLCAAVAPIGDIGWGYDFTNAPYGPFNREIHVASDMLVHRGYALLTGLRVQRDSKVRASYRITERGIAEVKLICTLKRENDRFRWVAEILKVLDLYGPRLVTKLAYQEPTFNRMRRQNKGGAIDLSIDENQSLRLLTWITHVLKKEFAIDVDTVTCSLIVYFDYLSRSIGQGSTA